MKPEQLEIAQAQGEVTKLKAERSILKRAGCGLLRDVKFSFIAKHWGIRPADWGCGRSVSRVVVYAWLTRRSERSRDDKELGAKVRATDDIQRLECRAPRP